MSELSYFDWVKFTLACDKYVVESSRCTQTNKPCCKNLCPKLKEKLLCPFCNADLTGKTPTEIRQHLLKEHKQDLLDIEQTLTFGLIGAVTA
jgi:hypothetical protein